MTIDRTARIPAAVIGLTIVSMGTSLPELTVSVAMVSSDMVWMLARSA